MRSSDQDFLMRSTLNYDLDEWEQVYLEEADRVREARAPHQDLRRLRTLRDPVERTRHELESRQLAARQADRRVHRDRHPEPRQTFQEYWESLRRNAERNPRVRAYVDHNKPLPSRDAPQGSLNIITQYARHREDTSIPPVDNMPATSDLYKRRREREKALKEAKIADSASRREKRQATKKARTGSADGVPPTSVVAGSSHSRPSDKVAETRQAFKERVAK